MKGWLYSPDEPEGKVFESPEYEKRLADGWVDTPDGVVFPEEDEEGDPLDGLRASDLIAYAREHNLDIGNLVVQSGKVKILAAIKEAEALFHNQEPAAPSEQE